MAPTTGVVAAAEDEVSAAIALLFSNHAQEFQALSAQAGAFHTQFVDDRTPCIGPWQMRVVNGYSGQPSQLTSRLPPAHSRRALNLNQRSDQILSHLTGLRDYRRGGRMVRKAALASSRSRMRVMPAMFTPAAANAVMRAIRVRSAAL
jgi:hypothetical protein